MFTDFYGFSSAKIRVIRVIRVLSLLKYQRAENRWETGFFGCFFKIMRRLIRKERGDNLPTIQQAHHSAV